MSTPPPPLGTVFDTPPVPAFDRILAFCRSGGEYLAMIADVTLRAPRYACSLPLLASASDAIDVSYVTPLHRRRPLLPPSAMVTAVFRWHLCGGLDACLIYTSPSPRDGLLSRMPSSA